MPEFGGQNWSAVFLQKFEGTVTIWPRSRRESPSCRTEELALMRWAVLDWVHILTDPDRDELARMMRVGQSVTWPKASLYVNVYEVILMLDVYRSR